MVGMSGAVGEYVDDVTQPQLLWSAGGVAVASLLGAAFTVIPFYKVPLGNIVRTGALLGGGAWVFNWGKTQFNPGRASGAAMAGGLLFTAGLIQVMGYASNLVESTTGFRIPFLSSVGNLLAPAGLLSAAEDATMDLLPQQGDGSVIGQQTATRNYTDIRNAEGVDAEVTGPTNANSDWSFEDMNYDMVERVPMDDPMDSILEQAPLGHGVTQNFGAEALDSTNAVTPYTDASDFGHKANLMGVRSLDPFGEQNPFVESVHPWTPSYQPPVWYAEDVTMPVEEPSPTPEVGGMADTLNTYIIPSHTMSSAGGSGHGIIEWFGAEGSNVARLSRHVSQAEGAGHVIGQ